MKQLSDKQLYSECRKWGTAALKARWKFAGLLPEVYRRNLYRKRGFTCIYEFAARLSGMSRDQVDQVLRLEKKFIDKPVLKTALTQGKISVNKLARIASIATIENQQEILTKTETLSKAALDIFVQDFKIEQINKTETENSIQKPKNIQKSLPGQSETETRSATVNLSRKLNLDPDVLSQLAELQQKGIDINNLLRKFFKEREEKIDQKIQEISTEIQTEEAEKATIGIQPTRYKKIKITKIITEKYGTKCSQSNCNRPTAHIHHEKPFATNHTHDPLHLKPLCKAHHELAHTQDTQVQKFRNAHNKLINPSHLLAINYPQL